MKRVIPFLLALLLLLSLYGCSNDGIFYLTSPKDEDIFETDKHTDDSEEIKDVVYWLNKGSVYHLYSDCSYIKDKEFLSGPLAECGISKLCSRCEKRDNNNAD